MDKGYDTTAPLGHLKELIAMNFYGSWFCASGLMSFDKPLMYGTNNLQSDHFFQKSAPEVLGCRNGAKVFDTPSLPNWLEVYQ